ncbi:MAG: pseudouridine-5'-phosphate glycosidase [Rhizobiaceae bacterium]
MTIDRNTMIFSASVAAALKSGAPVVALESTIITHGMPWPENVETARAVEAAVIEQGAVPATIAVIDGVLNIGLSDEQLDHLGQATDVMKLSRADFGFAIAQGCTGSTTVAATMMAAEMAGISVFATGGIGGVHRGAETSFDVSADLAEFTRTNVIVVCAGAKAILDLEKTMEVLETNGVPVIGYGTDELPAFWSRESGIPAPLRMDSAAEIAAHAATRGKMGIVGGTLITNPVPVADEIPRAEMSQYIEQALNDAATAGIVGKAVTPYLLSRMAELTDGRSLATNIALITNNARVAGEIAVAMVG